jgi:hypothetical protein
MAEGVKKSHLRALEKVFAKDIENALAHRNLPFQSTAKVYRELEAEGMVRSVTVKVGTGWSAVEVTGWELTQLGHLSYCMECDE